MAVEVAAGAVVVLGGAGVGVAGQDLGITQRYPSVQFLTNSDEPTAAADITHRQHAIIETVFADLIDGPLAHMPSGRFAANSAWAICAAITHNLLRAAGTLAGPRLAAARGATLRRQIINVPARIAHPQRRSVLHLPAHWPWAEPWTALWNGVFPAATGPPATWTREEYLHCERIDSADVRLVPGRMSRGPASVVDV
jgi:hypothetical protein